jgi:hypothetical protein
MTVGFEASRGVHLPLMHLLTIAALDGEAPAVRTGPRPSAAAARLKDTELVDRAAEMTPRTAVVASLYRYRELLKNLIS